MRNVWVHNESNLWLGKSEHSLRHCWTPHWILLKPNPEIIKALSHQCCGGGPWHPFHADLVFHFLPLLFPFAATFYAAAHHADQNQQDDGSDYSIDGPSWHCCKNTVILSPTSKQRSGIAPWHTSEDEDSAQPGDLREVKLITGESWEARNVRKGWN